MLDDFDDVLLQDLPLKAFEYALRFSASIALKESRKRRTGVYLQPAGESKIEILANRRFV